MGNGVVLVVQPFIRSEASMLMINVRETPNLDIRESNHFAL